MEGLVEGRIVHYVMPNGEHTPAIVLKVWDSQGNTGTANLMVLTDGSNALPSTPEEKELFTMFSGMNLDEIRHGHIWQTSKTYSEVPQPGTWHWIEKA